MTKLCVESAPVCDQRWCDAQNLIGPYARANGLEVASSYDDSDFAALFTCVFNADSQARSLQLLEAARERLPPERIVVLGCLSKAAPHLLKEQVAGALGPREMDRLDELFCRLGILSRVVLPYESIRYSGVVQASEETLGEETYFLNLGEGCALGTCAYCVINRACGRLQSVPEAEVARTFEDGSRAGMKRFRLVGEDVAAYGWDLGTDLASLLATLRSRARRMGRTARFNTFMNGMNPEWMLRYDRPLLAQLAEEDCHFDGMQLSVQSFDPEILRLCRRPGDPARWVELIHRIKEASPETELWLQVIVGFPGQTLDSVDKELDTIDGLPVDVVHYYAYSPVEGSWLARRRDLPPPRDRLFERFVEVLPRHRGRIAQRDGNSLLVTRFTAAGPDPANHYYHHYRGIVS